MEDTVFKVLNNLAPLPFTSSSPTPDTLCPGNTVKLMCHILFAVLCTFPLHAASLHQVPFLHPPHLRSDQGF